MITNKYRSKDVFLTNISKMYVNGDYDQYIIMPFMTKELFITCVSQKLDKKINKGLSAVLTDTEIKEVFSQMYDICLEIVKLYTDSGIIKSTDNIYELSFDPYKLVKIAKTLISE